MLAISLNPKDWFETKLSVILNLAVFIKVGLFIKIPFVGTIELVLYEKTWEYKKNLLGPYTWKPKRFSKMADVSSDGKLEIEEDNLTCKSRGGSVGEEGEYHVGINSCSEML